MIFKHKIPQQEGIGAVQVMEVCIKGSTVQVMFGNLILTYFQKGTIHPGLGGTLPSEAPQGCCSPVVHAVLIGLY